MKLRPKSSRTRSKTPSKKSIHIPTLYQMRNMIFQGTLNSSYLLYGKGVVLTDDNIMYFGDFKHDTLHGFGILIFDDSIRQDHYKSRNKNFAK